MIARHHHHIEVRRHIEHPVELRQRIMQVGYQEEAHGEDTAVRSGGSEAMARNVIALALLLRIGWTGRRR